jgi:hypothetical protein
MLSRIYGLIKIFGFVSGLRVNRMIRRIEADPSELDRIKHWLKIARVQANFHGDSEYVEAVDAYVGFLEFIFEDENEHEHV